MMSKKKKKKKLLMIKKVLYHIKTFQLTNNNQIIAQIKTPNKKISQI